MRERHVVQTSQKYYTVVGKLELAKHRYNNRYIDVSRTVAYLETVLQTLGTN